MGRPVAVVPLPENLPTVEPVTTAPPVDSINGDLSALKDSPKILPHENALGSGSSLLPLGLDVTTDKTDSSPVSVESKPPCPPEQLAKFLNGIEGKELAPRLNRSEAWLSGIKDADTLFRKTSKLDPNGLPWRKEGEHKKTRYFPVIPTPPDPSPD